MNLADQKKVMVRVAVNEFQTKSDNCNVPYGPEEVSKDAIECAKAGASIIHFHSRHGDGRQATDDDLAGANIYRRAIELTAARSDIIMEPTNLPHGKHECWAVEDLPHIWALYDLPPENGSLEVVNIDAFRFKHLQSGYDVHKERLVTIDEKQKMRPDLPFQLPECIQQALDKGLKPFFGVFNMSDLRLLSAYAAERLVPTPVLVQINFFADLMWGPTPTVEALDAFLWQWNRQNIDSEVSVLVRGLPDFKTYEYLLDATLDRGISMRVGLGDNPAIFEGSNAHMVEHFVNRVSKWGLEPASPNDLRERVGISRR